MRKLIEWLFLFVIIFMVALVSRKIFDNNSLLSKNTRYLEGILTDENNLTEDGSEGNVKDLIKLDYDKMYVFGPYEPVEDMEQKIGLKTSKLRTGVSEGTNNILLVKDNKEIVYLSGYPSSSGYYIDIPTGEYSKSEIDKMNYTIEKRGVRNSSGVEQTYIYYKFEN